MRVISGPTATRILVMSLRLLDRELVESAGYGFSQQVFVREIEQRIPISLDHAMRAIGPANAETVRYVQERKGRLRGQPGLAHAIGVDVLVVSAFECDKRARRGERDEPMLVER